MSSLPLSHQPAVSTLSLVPEGQCLWYPALTVLKQVCIQGCEIATNSNTGFVSKANQVSSREELSVKKKMKLNQSWMKQWSVWWDGTALTLYIRSKLPSHSTKHLAGCSYRGYSYQLCHMKIYTCSINFNSLLKSYYTKQGAISEVEMDFQNNIKTKMFSGLWFLNLWVKLNLFHSTVDIPYRNIHKYQALQNIMSESKGRSYPAVQKKCCNHCSQKSLSLMLWSFFLMYWLQKRRKFSILRCNYLQQRKKHHK